jgi:hypothetical protein
MIRSYAQLVDDEAAPVGQPGAPPG